MERQYRVNPGKFFIVMLFSAVVLVCSIIMLSRGRTLSGAVFLIVGLVFGALALPYGAVVTVDHTGVRKKLFGKTLLDRRWEEIAEVGVAGTKVFHGKDAKRTGELYIYFSAQTMTEDQRFQMMLNWPPRDMAYLSYDKNRLEAIHLLWGGGIASYNVGKTQIL